MSVSSSCIPPLQEDWDTSKITQALEAAGLVFESCIAYDGVGWELSYHTRAYYALWRDSKRAEPIKIDVRQMCRERAYTWMGAGQVAHSTWHSVLRARSRRPVPL